MEPGLSLPRLAPDAKHSHCSYMLLALVSIEGTWCCCFTATRHYSGRLSAVFLLSNLTGCCPITTKLSDLFQSYERAGIFPFGLSGLAESEWKFSFANFRAQLCTSCCGEVSAMLAYGWLSDCKTKKSVI